MECLKNFFTFYTTTRSVHVRSPLIAVLHTVLVILVWCAFFGSIRLDVARVYQLTCPVHGGIVSKVKGFASTEHLTDEELSMQNSSLYRRTWDPADIVYPVQGGEGETGSFSIVTNLIITPNQTLGTCPEINKLRSNCKVDADCKDGYWSLQTHGVFTGKCVNQTGTCEIMGWCPPELRELPRKGEKPVLEDVENFTVMLKNSVNFPDCGHLQGRNIPHSMSEDYIKSCMYNKDKDPFCPIFRIGDIVDWSGNDFSRVAINGGVFRILVKWDCDFDWGRTAKDCFPHYTFTRVDDKEAGFSKGFNFRSAEFYSEDRRTLKKQFGLKILIDLVGEGRKFDLVQLVITLGSTVGLFAMVPLVCDFLLDIFNMLFSFKCCGQGLSSSFHDGSVSRYDEFESVEGTVTTTNCKIKYSEQRLGTNDLGTSSSSTMSGSSNETFGQLPCAELNSKSV